MSIRAFELVPALEKIQLLGDKAKIAIESMECCGKFLYLGTNDSFVIQYHLEEMQIPNGKVTFECIKKGYKYLGLKKPVQEIKAVSAINRLFIDCDSTFLLLNMFDLEPITNGPRIKGVHCFCMNENPSINNPFSIQVCIAKRRQLMIYNITEDKAIHLKDINVSEPPVTMAMDGKFLCAALSTHYVIINCDHGYIQDLFPYDAIVTKPLVKRIGKEEFLLNSPGALGMFVTTAGTSERPPIRWFENLCAATYSHPYVLAMDANFIAIYSILDQQLKQNLPFQAGCLLGNFDGKLFAVSCSSVYAAVAIPWEKQVQALLADERIKEALELAQHVNHFGLSKDQYVKVFQRIQQQAGFIELSHLNFDEARELFRSSNLDVRELISLYPNLLPSSCNFMRSVPSLHHIADVKQMCHGNEEDVIASKKFLIQYLEDIRSTRMGQDFKLEIDTALLKLYADINSPELTLLIVSSGNSQLLDECAEWLERYHRYNALALYHRCHNNNEKALAIWAKILTGNFMDESFPGLEFLVEVLANLSDHHLVWKYVDLIFEKDPDHAVKIFIDRPKDEYQTSQMKPDVVVEYLHLYPKALVKYLEYLVFEKKLAKEKFHTHLATLYLDTVLEMERHPDIDSNQLGSARKKLQIILQVSSLYRVQFLLGKIEKTNLYFEMAILYGKLEQHEKALKILVHQLNDPEAAKHYCSQNSRDRDMKYKHCLFHTLLGVYLDPNLDAERHTELLIFAIQLLNNEASEFDIAKVLQLIPHHWSVGIVEQFLQRVLRISLNTQRNKSIECNLSKGQNVNVKFTKYDLFREPIFVTEERTCAACSLPFTEPQFARHPSGILTHTQCSSTSKLAAVPPVQ